MEVRLGSYSDAGDRYLAGHRGGSRAVVASITVTATLAPPRVGVLLREWRRRRRRSQLDLAVSAGVSARHLSFVETGRARPSRQLVLHLAEHLDVPLRDRNALLLAAGFAPAYRRTPLDAAEMAPVRDAVAAIVRGHGEFPALVVDRHWTVVDANPAARDLMAEGVDPALLGGPVNALRVALHPGGMAPRIVNFAEWAGHLTARLDREITATADEKLIALRDELRGYPGVGSPAQAADIASRLFVPLVIRHRGREQRFISTVTTFGTARDITVAELAVESFYPA